METGFGHPSVSLHWAFCPLSLNLNLLSGHLAKKASEERDSHSSLRHLLWKTFSDTYRSIFSLKVRGPSSPWTSPFPTLAASSTITMGRTHRLPPDGGTRPRLLQPGSLAAWAGKGAPDTEELGADQGAGLGSEMTVLLQGLERNFYLTAWDTGEL